MVAYTLVRRDLNWQVWTWNLSKWSIKQGEMKEPSGVSSLGRGQMCRGNTEKEELWKAWQKTWWVRSGRKHDRNQVHKNPIQRTWGMHWQRENQESWRWQRYCTSWGQDPNNTMLSAVVQVWFWSKRAGGKEGWADGVPDCSVGPRMSRSCQEVFKAKITIRGVPDPVSLVRKGFISPRRCSVVEPKKLCMTKMVSRRNME